MSDYRAAILALLLDWIAKGFVILGMAFLADLLFRRAHASVRHLIWLVGMTAVMLLPIAAWMLPSWDVPLLHLGFLEPGPSLDAGSAQPGIGAAFGWNTPGILLGVYIGGILLVFAWQLIGRAYAYRLRRHAVKVVRGRIIVELQRLRAAVGIRKSVQLLSSDLISIPFSTGYLRPVIVLPRAAASWPLKVVESVLIHELAHIKRKDILARIAAQMSCCIHWINPLAWYALGRIMMEQEIACDSLVLGTGTKASDYARNLLALAEMRRGRMDFALTALGRRTELKHRLLEILKPTRTRTPLQVDSSLLFLSLTFGLLLPVSAVNLWNASDARMALRPQGAVIRQQPEKPRTVVISRPSGAAAKPLPDVAKAKEEFSKKIRDMKEQGVPQEEIDKFTRQAKAKIEYLQMEKAREAEEKRKQMEQMMLSEGKKAG